MSLLKVEVALRRDNPTEVYFHLGISKEDNLGPPSLPEAHWNKKVTSPLFRRQTGFIQVSVESDEINITAVKRLMKRLGYAHRYSEGRTRVYRRPKT